MPGAPQQAGGGHRALAVPAHHHRAGRRVRCQARQRAKFPVDRAGDVPGPVLAVLPDVEHGAAADPVGGDQLGRLHRAAVRLPGAHAAVQLPGQLLVADLEGLPGHLGPILARGEYEGQRNVIGDQPAQPGGELAAQRDGHRAGDVPGREVRHRPDVDQPAS